MIIQVGPYPPPYGGISIYLKRFKKYLDDKGYSNLVLTTSGIIQKHDKIINVKFKLIPFLFC
ncbi:unnamed protein product [marine sediment metagenome]|uniref:Uncharacterized protein n=1 Tax=marine sediment metagenome TaxID=412755 RepID=X1HEJ5_9ZZZZ